MTKKQLENIKALYDILTKACVDLNNVQLADFRGPMQEAKIMMHWSILNAYLHEDGSYKFHALFEKALGISPEITMPESFPLSQFTELKTTTTKSKPKKTSPKDPPKKSTVAVKPPSLTAGIKIKHFEEPVFLVESVDSTGETSVTGITRKWDKVWNTLRNRAIHDHGKLSEEQAKETVDHMGVVIIQSNASNNLYCVVTKMELE
jgi:hypothetical protein